MFDTTKSSKVNTTPEQQIKVDLSFLRIIFTEKQIAIKKPSYKNKLQKEKTNYDRSFDHFGDRSLMALVFLDPFMMVYKPMNARGARSLNIFPCFAVHILEMKQETETMVNNYY